MERLEYYSIRVKLLNQSEIPPDRLTGAPSDSVSLHEYRVFLKNDQNWTKEIKLAISDVIFEGNHCVISKILIDNYAVTVNKYTEQDQAKNGFFYQFVFEMWVFNQLDLEFQFDKRWVTFWFAVAP